MVDSEITFGLENKQGDAGTHQHRDSSSSEDRIDTSDELMEVDINDQFIADCAAEANHKRSYPRDEVEKSDRDRAREQADEMIREAGASRANIFNTPGNINNSFPRQMGSDKHTNHQQLALPSTAYDENYIIVGSHMDPALKEKMRKGEYVDFARILPKDKMQGEEDHRLELVYKGGQTFFIPANEREIAGGGITNFHKWEQAFRVYSNEYLMAHPN